MNLVLSLFPSSERYKLTDACRLQGLPESFLSDAPFTAQGKLKAVANGVPITMGRAVARAIKECLSSTNITDKLRSAAAQ